MNRGANERFADILNAIERCLKYRAYLNGTDETISLMAYDAVLRNLAVIGEAVRAIPSETRQLAPNTHWASIAGLRNIVIHEYFRVNRDLVEDILNNELVPLAEVIRLHIHD